MLTEEELRAIIRAAYYAGMHYGLTTGTKYKTVAERDTTAAAYVDSTCPKT
jgi:hypothetical protein